MSLGIMKDYYTEEEVMLFLGCKKKTLQTNRSVGKNHPPFKKFGYNILYPKKLFHEWVESKALRVELQDAV